MKQTEQHQQSTTQAQHQGAQLTRSEQGEVRRESHRDTSSRLDERGKSSMQSSERSGALAADGKAAALRTEGQGNNGGSGGGQQQGEGGGGQKDGGAAAGFRFNPALMAPVPVARPRETATSDRLRAVANEIAQKIVERVRVGTNAAGKAEFQIDLRSNVLSGLSIKVSSRNGRIDASFSGSNREVLALLEQNAESLRKTLSGRGLTLGDLVVQGAGLREGNDTRPPLERTQVVVAPIFHRSGKAWRPAKLTGLPRLTRAAAGLAVQLEALLPARRIAHASPRGSARVWRRSSRRRSASRSRT